MGKLKVAKLRNWALFIIFWGFLIVTFVFFSFLIVLKANGYQLNYNNWKITKTGMIILDGTSNPVTIQINNRTLKNGFPQRISNLPVGTYEIKIKKSDYITWQKDIKVRGGLVESYKDIVLFYQNPKDTSAPINLTADNLKEESLNYSRNLKIIESEIYLNDKLITRFSKQILAAALYPDEQHLVFQVANEIRVIDIDGSNNNLLFKLANSDPTYLSFRDSGSNLIYLENNQVKAKVIH